MLRRLASFLVLIASPALGAPPAPLPPGTVERDAPIVNVPTPDGISAYLQHFASNVGVFENQKEIARGIPAWRAYLESKRYFGHKIWMISHGDPIIVVESNWLLHNECCLSARVVTYHLGEDGLVDEVRITSNGTYWGQPPNPQ